MTDETTNIVLEHLRALRAGMGRLEEDNVFTKARLSSIEHQLAALHGDVAALHADGATVNDQLESIKRRLDRIERRLDLTDA